MNPDTGDVRPITLADVRDPVAPGDDLMDARTRMLDLRPGDRLPDGDVVVSAQVATRIADGDRRRRDARRRKQKARRRRNGRGG